MDSSKVSSEEGDSLPTLIVLRHSERLDESNPAQWDSQIREEYPEEFQKSFPSRTGTRRPSLKGSIKRDFYSFCNDTPLSTTNGPHYANKAATTLYRWLRSFPSSPHICLYCTRLQRAVETAVPVARQLQVSIVNLVMLSSPTCLILSVTRKVPIILSTKLSEVLVAVRKKSNFQFLETSDWTARYPDVTFLDDDFSETTPRTGVRVPQQSHESWDLYLHRLLRACAADVSGENVAQTKHVDEPVKDTRADATLPTRRSVLIVVAHRETIKTLAKLRGKLPYCALATFDVPWSSKEYPHSTAATSSSAPMQPQPVAVEPNEEVTLQPLSSASDRDHLHEQTQGRSEMISSSEKESAHSSFLPKIQSAEVAALAHTGITASDKNSVVGYQDMTTAQSTAVSLPRLVDISDKNAFGDDVTSGKDILSQSSAPTEPSASDQIAGEGAPHLPTAPRDVLTKTGGNNMVEKAEGAIPHTLSARSKATVSVTSMSARDSAKRTKPKASRGIAGTRDDHGVTKELLVDEILPLTLRAIYDCEGGLYFAGTKNM